MRKEIQIQRIATDDVSHIHNSYQRLFYTQKAVNKPVVIGGKYKESYHLYATVSQEVEPIKAGDWYLNLHNKQPLIATADFAKNYKNNMSYNDGKDFLRDNHRKIIATTDKKLKLSHEHINSIKIDGVECNLLPRFEQSFIKEYCDKGGIDKALVDYSSIIKKSQQHKYSEIDIKNSLILKLNSDNTIVITKIESICRHCGKEL